MVVTPLVIVFLVGHRIIPFESPWSTMTNRELNPLEMGKSVMRSWEICLNGKVSFEGMGFNGSVIRWVFVLFCWHRVHPSTYFLMSCAISDHQCPVEISCLVLRYPGWLAVWWLWNFWLGLVRGCPGQEYRFFLNRRGSLHCRTNQIVLIWMV